MSLSIKTQVSIPLGRENIEAYFISFQGFLDNKEHFAIYFPWAESDAAPLVRIHSECITGDVFNSSRCDCGQQLKESVARIAKSGGYLLYLRQEGRGIGLYAKLQAYELQTLGYNTYAANRLLNHPSDARDFSPAADMLKALNINRVRLLTNNPDKIDALRSGGIVVHEVVATETYATPNNVAYLKAKIELARHTLKESALTEVTRP